jgi:hypothetical protein
MSRPEILRGNEPLEPFFPLEARKLLGSPSSEPPSPSFGSSSPRRFRHMIRLRAGTHRAVLAALLGAAGGILGPPQRAAASARPLSRTAFAAPMGLKILGYGDSLTAGWHDNGMSLTPYAPALQVWESGTSDKVRARNRASEVASDREMHTHRELPRRTAAQHTAAGSPSLLESPRSIVCVCVCECSEILVTNRLSGCSAASTG